MDEFFVFWVHGQIERHTILLPHSGIFEFYWLVNVNYQLLVTWKLGRDQFFVLRYNNFLFLHKSVVDAELVNYLHGSILTLFDSISWRQMYNEEKKPIYVTCFFISILSNICVYNYINDRQSIYIEIDYRTAVCISLIG